MLMLAFRNLTEFFCRQFWKLGLLSSGIEGYAHIKDYFDKFWWFRPNHLTCLYQRFVYSRDMKFFLFLLLFPFQLFSQTCSEATSLDWILSEFDSYHPRLLIERLNLDKIKAGEAEAGKIINPELEHFSVWGKEFGGVRAYQNESRLWFTLQLSNKRKKSLAAWARETSMAQEEVNLLKQALLKDLWLNFFRLHQIYKEVDIKKTLIRKLEKVVAGYRSRKFLSPDQQLEQRIFIMVVDNFDLTLDQLERERIDILGFFREITGFKCPIRSINSEGSEINWPTSDSIKSLKDKEILNLKLAESSLELTRSRTILAESRKIPNLRLSPVVQNYINDEVNNTMAGVSFVFPLPVFDRNQSERLQSALDEKYAQKKVEVTRSREEFLFESTLEKYVKGLRGLKEIVVIDQSVQTFEKLGNAFSEGKISISNIVDFCRQLDEILLRFHHGETLLMKDLMSLYEQRGLLNKATFEKLL